MSMRSQQGTVQLCSAPGSVPRSAGSTNGWRHSHMSKDFRVESRCTASFVRSKSTWL